MAKKKKFIEIYSGDTPKSVKDEVAFRKGKIKIVEDRLTGRKFRAIVYDE